MQNHLPKQRGHQLPVVVIEAPPYLSGGSPITNHDVDVPQATPGAADGSSYEELLLPRGYAYVYAESIGT